MKTIRQAQDIIADWDADARREPNFRVVFPAELGETYTHSLRQTFLQVDAQSLMLHSANSSSGMDGLESDDFRVG